MPRQLIRRVQFVAPPLSLLPHPLRALLPPHQPSPAFPRFHPTFAPLPPHSYPGSCPTFTPLPPRFHPTFFASFRTFRITTRFNGGTYVIAAARFSLFFFSFLFSFPLLRPRHPKPNYPHPASTGE